MSDHNLLLFFNMSNQFLAPGGLHAECVQVSVMLTWGLQGAGSEAPQGLKSSKCSKLIVCNIIIVIGTHFIFLFFE